MLQSFLGPIEGTPFITTKSGFPFVDSSKNQQVKKADLAKASDPTALDDSGAGYSIGSRIITTSGKVWECVDASPLAAVWKDLSATSPPGGSNGQLQYNNAGAFGGVQDSVVSGPDVTFGGKVGIGVTPLNKLHIVDSDGAPAFFDSPNISDTSIKIRNSSPGGRLWYFGTTGSASPQGAGDFNFYDSVAGLNRITIDTDGNFGINKTNPTAHLHQVVPAIDRVGHRIDLASGQTANAFEVNSFGGSGGNLAKINSAGRGTLTGADLLDNLYFGAGASQGYLTWGGSGLQLVATGNLNLGSGTGTVEINNGTAGQYRDLIARAIGIGISPVQTLHLSDTSDVRLLFTVNSTGHTNSDGVFLGFDGLQPTFSLWQRENGDIRIGTNDVERWRFKNTGHLIPTSTYDIGSTSFPVNQLVENSPVWIDPDGSGTGEIIRWGTNLAGGYRGLIADSGGIAVRDCNGGIAALFAPSATTIYDNLNVEGATTNFGSNAQLNSSGIQSSFGTVSATPLYLFTGNTTRWQLGTDGHWKAYVDNTYDIGASGANRPRNIYAAQNVFAAPASYIGFDSPAGVQGLNYANGTGAVHFFHNTSNERGYYNGTDWRLNGTLNLYGTQLFGVDNTYDIGASGANRPRDIFVGRNITAMKDKPTSEFFGNGASSAATGEGHTCVGYNAIQNQGGTAAFGTAIGNNANCEGYGVALGARTYAAESSIAIGYVAGTPGTSGGVPSSPGVNNYIVIGSGIVPTQSNEINIGNIFLRKTTGAEIKFGADGIRVDGSLTAGETRFLLYDVDSALMQRVKVGANGTGPGGVGRALYIVNA